jgi:hypothetical protein
LSAWRDRHHTIIIALGQLKAAASVKRRPMSSTSSCLAFCVSSVVPLDREMLLKLLFALSHGERRSPAQLGMRWRVALN